MSGCCGQGPVIVAGTPATPRVEVETVLLCDVAADGTVAATVLVEPVYDTSSGARIGTRTVDPATGDPYTPVGTLRPCSPEGCTATTSAQVLCDLQADGTAAPFIRATTYDCDGALLATLDRTLDGAAYTVTGTVGVCPAVPDCDSPTTPVTSVGLCLADGTPIAVTVVRDCAGAVAGEGWVNLVTGAYSAGAPPAGTVACGDSRSITTNGTFCDVLADGTVAGLVLVEYQYAADGSIDTVRLVDAVTGTTYTPQGTVTTCPAGVEQPEQDVVQLCDVAADGTVTAMIRDYRRDELGAIVGHADYTLDGAPYAPTGTVGVCPSPCRSAHTLTLCDSTPQTFALTGTYLPLTEIPIDTPNTNELDVGPVLGQQLWDGQSVTFGPSSGTHDLTYVAGALAVDCPGCGQPDDQVTVTISLQATLDGPTAGQGSTGGLQLLNGTTGLAASAFPSDTAVGWTGTPTVTSTVPLADLLAGRIRVRLGAETSQAGPKSWTFSGFTATATRTSAGCGTSFLRTIRTDCVTGELVDVIDTDHDGQPYTPVGDVAPCRPDSPCTAEPCQGCETLLLCDVADEPPATITGTAGSGTLSNGVTWTATGSVGTTVMVPRMSNSDGAWWGLPTFPFTVTSPTRWTFSRPSVAEFSVYLRHYAADPAINRAQLPPGLEVVHLPDGYAYDAATGVLTRTAEADPADPCTYVTDPQIETSARFRTAGPVTSFTTAPPPNSRRAVCGVFFTYWAGAVTVAPGGPFLRTVCRACDGTVSTVTDTQLDGQTPYTVAGTAAVCGERTVEPTPCLHCETQTLCDVTPGPTDFFAPPNYTGGTLPNGRAYTVTGLGGPVLSQPGVYAIPAAGAGSAFTFTEPVQARWKASLNAGAVLQLPAGTVLEELHPAHQWDPATARLTGGTGASTSGAPSQWSAFSHPSLTSLTIQQAAAPPVSFAGGYEFALPAPTAFVRTVCRDCDGAVVSTTDTTLDGQPYTVAGTVGVCQTPEPEPCCQPVQVCIQQDTTQTVEFISNEDHRNDNTVDPVWKWTTDLNAANPPWYDMYQRQYSSAWSVVDSDTARPAWWVSPHPGATSTQSSPPLPNEGPTLLNAHWYPRAFFDLPDNADPASIRVQATVVNADQIGRAFRLNGGAWQALPATATHNGTTYTFGPDTIPGAQAGRNYLYLDVEETVGGGAGLMVHLKVFYEVIPETRSWTRMVCCDGSVYYLDEDGVRQDAVPDGWHVAPCGGGGSAGTAGCTKQVVERCGCDDTDGDGLGDVRYAELWAVDPCGGEPPVLLGTYRDGDLAQPYTPTAPVECTTVETLPGPLSTGVRAVTGTAPQNLVAAFPGLQSVSLTVLAGAVNVTMNDGAAVPLPAGVTMTWSVAQDADNALAAASFTGASAAASYLLNWTYR
ncbi:hypothetical protein [Streptomyces sp. DH8]|uniref:hypothetical protein n=1 Tax=Streptomyces sp. DH8 TaxID=2857008 RepID=UPI001E299317|nr:hypothetical protein [Streptomyces sp. DH8]